MFGLILSPLLKSTHRTVVRGVAGDASRLPHLAFLPNDFGLELFQLLSPGNPHEIGVEDLPSEVISIYHLRADLDVHDQSIIVLQTVHLVIDNI